MLRCIAGSIEFLFAILTILHYAVAVGAAVGVAVAVVSFAAVFRDVTQRSPERSVA